MTRRHAIAAAVTIGASLAHRLKAAGNSVNHSVCKWCYAKTPLETLCQSAKDIGLSSIELLGPNDWPMLQKYGLTCAMATNPTVDGLGGITKAFNRVENHDKLVAAYEDYIPKAAAAGLKNVICFSGNRDGMPDEQGLENCAKGLQRLMPTAEKHKINLVMELLNSKVNHPDYMCDHTEWGVAMCKKVGSERMKLLYDIYHMQIMEGDVIATIKKHNAYIAHYHTGGVPGRHEIDDTQELYYPAIVKAIVETGFKGFVGQEFVPARADVLASLKQGVQICNV
jgi:hydroxypyruvate isomerase